MQTSNVWYNPALDSNSLPLAFTQSLSFPANVSAYFRRPSKIVKSVNRTVSPRNAGRRKAAAMPHLPTRNRSVVETRNHLLHQMHGQNMIQPRPTSWHPASTESFDALMTWPGASNPPQHGSYPGAPLAATEINGLFTPTTIPLVDEPQIQEHIAALDETLQMENSTQYTLFNHFDVTPDIYGIPKTYRDYSWDIPVYNHPQVQSQFYVPHEYGVPVVDTAPVSPDALPQHYLDSDPVDPPTDELVGMGLYDKPITQQESRLFESYPSYSSGRASLGKGLKLEESFEPNNTEEEDGEGEEDAQAEDVETIPQLCSTDSFSDFPQFTNADYHDMHHHQPAFPHALDNHGFLEANSHEGFLPTMNTYATYIPTHPDDLYYGWI